MRKFLIALLASFLLPQIAFGASGISVSGKIASASGYTVYLLFRDGSSKSVALTANGRFSFSRISSSKLRGARLHLADADGRDFGPVVLARRGTKVSTTFTGKVTSSARTIPLGRFTLGDRFARVRAKLGKSIYATPRVPASTSGRPIGAGESGLVLTSSSRVAARAVGIASSAEDSDLDGIPNSFDADDDGDLVLDGSDPDSSGSDVPYTNLVLDFRKTLNAHVESGLSDEAIDAIIGGENVFSLTFFLSLPGNVTADGGHIICDDSLSYCRRNNPLAFYGGVSESTSEFRNRPWSELLTSAGYPRMERINLTGGSAIVASIQPRVGRSQFRPGDVYRAVLTNGSREVSSRTFTLAPYFVSIPALQSYDAGSGPVTVDYSAVSPTVGSIPGTSPGDPIVLSSSGNLTLTFWRPQRQAIRSDETGFYDWGNLNYGVVIDQAQATCSGLYSGVSSDLVEDTTALGTGGSPLANQGANMEPFTDSQGDRAVNVANTLSLTVNLKDCAARVGLAPGTYSVNLSAAGSSVTGGRNVASQMLWIAIP